MREGSPWVPPVLEHATDYQGLLGCKQDAFLPPFGALVAAASDVGITSLRVGVNSFLLNGIGQVEDMMRSRLPRPRASGARLCACACAEKTDTGPRAHARAAKPSWTPTRAPRPSRSSDPTRMRHRFSRAFDEFLRRARGIRAPCRGARSHHPRSSSRPRAASPRRRTPSRRPRRRGRRRVRRRARRDRSRGDWEASRARCGEKDRARPNCREF